ncbi:hypothetical protein CARUB_v10014365mg [Capsella rubella]|uniref:GATA-type domain-containing protein n=1 Tax=Capsella rubella TaxID=81985 RepID=R0I4E2_9BRAS|nr:GATA transcription factor 1 isoform X2 [Capsella rubella]EOA31198.1 hypothetical protein CARUB_v10014365mg [Capsella rubella]
MFLVNGPGVVEEEDLEWISNKDAFPVIETFVGVLPPEHFRVTSPERVATEIKQLSPVSVLETSSHNSSTTTSTTTTTSNSSGGSTAVTTTTAATLMSCCVSFKAPAKARSKRRRTGRRDLRVLWTGNEQGGGGGGIQKKKTTAAVIMGRKCQHCGAEKTPQWRAGPSGPKTLCNACGVRYKSGRLVPEYRPANSPTFTAELHSNSHRKIVEMRKQYQSGDGDRKDCG